MDDLLKVEQQYDPNGEPNPRFVEATPADLIAVVRRGVESGTIKGEVVELSRAATQYKWRCGNCGTDHGEAGCDDPDLVDYVLWQSKPEPQEPGRYIVIGPVSDGGSET